LSVRMRRYMGGEKTMDELPPIPPRSWLDSLKAWWPFITGIAVAAWIAFTWVSEQRKSSIDRRAEAEKEAEVRLFEARKPFIAKQFELYVETAQVAGKLVSLVDSTAPDWDKFFRRYEQLYWTELSMVEDDGVKEAMQSFADLLRSVNAWRSSSRPPQERSVPNEEIDDLRQRSYRLARALRASVEKSWQIDLSRPAGNQ